MNLIVLAAGRGTRFYPTTKTIPKAMVRVHGKPLIEHCLSAFRTSVNKIIIVMNDETGMILESYLGREYEGIPVQYAMQSLTSRRGTWFAVQQVVPLLDPQEKYFIVTNCDDIYDREETAKVLSMPSSLAMGITKTIMPKKYLGILTHRELVTGYASHQNDSCDAVEDFFSNGLYILSKNILNLEPVEIAGGEYGLPQTLFKSLDEFPCRAIVMATWNSINCPADISRFTRP